MVQEQLIRSLRLGCIKWNVPIDDAYVYAPSQPSQAAAELGYVLPQGYRPPASAPVKSPLDDRAGAKAFPWSRNEVTLEDGARVPVRSGLSAAVLLRFFHSKKNEKRYLERHFLFQ